MHRSLVFLACFCLSLSAQAATGRVVKVLPHFLDLQGRHATSPSLFDRDAYQAYLRLHPALRSAVRFDIEWKTKGPADSPLTIRAELRGVARGNLPTQISLEKTVVPGGWFGYWTSLTAQGEDYTRLGEITAWRVTLWEGTRLLGEEKSFLW